MVCYNNKETYPLSLLERIKLLNLSIERAEFLLSCPIREPGKTLETSRGYDGGFSQLKEAARLGINVRDTAKMFKWKVKDTQTIADHFGIKFPKKTIYAKTQGCAYYTLLSPALEDEEPFYYA
jgi:hypothetical protein